MQFLAHLLLADVAELAGTESGSKILLIFACQNDPGMCDDWDPQAGGNLAILTDAAAVTAVAAPQEGEILLGAVPAIGYAEVDRDDYAESAGAWAHAHGGRSREVLGQLGGTPWWIQADETPDCPTCREPMRFIAQLEEGYDHRTSANFGGGGCGYAFVCLPCDRAAFLWQCS